MDQLGRSLNERDLRKISRDRRREEEDMRKMEEDRRKQDEQRNRILEEEMQKFQRQREELLRLVGERKADRRENARPLPDDIYSGGEASEEDLRNLVTVDNEITKT